MHDFGFSTPDNTSGLPNWRNYVCATVAHAASGCIPLHTWALSVRFRENDWKIDLEFLLMKFTQEDQEDMEDIYERCGDLLGTDVVGSPVELSYSYTITDHLPVPDWTDLRRVYTLNRRRRPDMAHETSSA